MESPSLGSDGVESGVEPLEEEEFMLFCDVQDIGAIVRGGANVHDFGGILDRSKRTNFNDLSAFETENQHAERVSEDYMRGQIDRLMLAKFKAGILVDGGCQTEEDVTMKDAEGSNSETAEEVDAKIAAAVERIKEEYEKQITILKTSLVEKTKVIVELAEKLQKANTPSDEIRVEEVIAKGTIPTEENVENDVLSKTNENNAEEIKEDDVSEKPNYEKFVKFDKNVPSLYSDLEDELGVKGPPPPMLNIIDDMPDHLKPLNNFEEYWEEWNDYVDSDKAVSDKKILNLLEKSESIKKVVADKIPDNDECSTEEDLVEKEAAAEAAAAEEELQNAMKLMDSTNTIKEGSGKLATDKKEDLPVSQPAVSSTQNIVDNIISGGAVKFLNAKDGDTKEEKDSTSEKKVTTPTGKNTSSKIIQEEITLESPIVPKVMPKTISPAKSSVSPMKKTDQQQHFENPAVSTKSEKSEIIYIEIEDSVESSAIGSPLKINAQQMIQQFQQADFSVTSQPSSTKSSQPPENADLSSLKAKVELPSKSVGILSVPNSKDIGIVAGNTPSKNTSKTASLQNNTSPRIGLSIPKAEIVIPNNVTNFGKGMSRPPLGANMGSARNSASNSKNSSLNGTPNIITLNTPKNNSKTSDSGAPPPKTNSTTTLPPRSVVMSANGSSKIRSNSASTSSTPLSTPQNKKSGLISGTAANRSGSLNPPQLPNVTNMAMNLNALQQKHMLTPKSGGKLLQYNSPSIGGAGVNKLRGVGLGLAVSPPMGGGVIVHKRIISNSSNPGGTVIVRKISNVSNPVESDKSKESKDSINSKDSSNDGSQGSSSKIANSIRTSLPKKQKVGDLDEIKAVEKPSETAESESATPKPTQTVPQTASVMPQTKMPKKSYSSSDEAKAQVLNNVTNTDNTTSSGILPKTSSILPKTVKTSTIAPPQQPSRATNNNFTCRSLSPPAGVKVNNAFPNFSTRPSMVASPLDDGAHHSKPRLSMGNFGQGHSTRSNFMSPHRNKILSPPVNRAPPGLTRCQANQDCCLLKGPQQVGSPRLFNATPPMSNLLPRSVMNNVERGRSPVNSKSSTGSGNGNGRITMTTRFHSPGLISPGIMPKMVMSRVVKETIVEKKVEEQGEAAAAE